MILTKRQAIIAEARKYLGAPYSHFGRTKQGIDCIGLVIVVGQANGLVPADLQCPPYQRSSLPHLMDVLWQYVDPIEIADVQPGDCYLLCHDVTKNRRPRHVGFASETGLIWLSWNPTIERVVEQRIPDEIRAAIVGAFRFKGLA